MNAALTFADAVGGFTSRIGRLFGWLMLPLIFVIMFDVVTRKLDVTRLFFSGYGAEYGFSVSTILQDFEWHLHGALLLMSFGFGYLANAHVRVDVFRELLPRRSQGRLEFFALLFMAVPCLVVLLWYSGLLFELSWSQNEGSDSLTGIGARYIIKFFFPLGIFVLLLAVIVTLIRLAAYLFGDEALRQRAERALSIFSDDQSALEEARSAAEAALRAEAERAAALERKARGGR